MSYSRGDVLLCKDHFAMLFVFRFSCCGHYKMDMSYSNVRVRQVSQHTRERRIVLTCARNGGAAHASKLSYLGNTARLGKQSESTEFQLSAA